MGSEGSVQDNHQAHSAVGKILIWADQLLPHSPGSVVPPLPLLISSGSGAQPLTLINLVTWTTAECSKWSGPESRDVTYSTPWQLLRGTGGALFTSQPHYSPMEDTRSQQLCKNILHPQWGRNTSSSPAFLPLFYLSIASTCSLWAVDCLMYFQSQAFG